MRENYKKSAPWRARILACAIARTKMDAVSESREMALIALIGQIMNIGSGRARKFQMERSRDGLKISMRDKLLEKGCSIKITRDRTGSIFRPNNEYWKWSGEKIINRALSGGPGY